MIKIHREFLNACLQQAGEEIFSFFIFKQLKI